MKKILFFTYDFPYPTNSGGKVRAYNLLKFAHKGFDVILDSFTRPAFKDSYVDEVLKLGISDIRLHERQSIKSLKNFRGVIDPSWSILKSLYFQKRVEENLIESVQFAKVDIIHFESLYTSYYISEKLRSLGVKQIYGTENIEYKNYNDYARKIPPILNIPFQHQVNKIKKEEQQFARDSDITLAITQEEAEYFQQVGAKKTAVIPNGVDIHEFAFKQSFRPEGKKLLFVGNFSYFPNKDGIMFFYKEIFPKLTGDVQLNIIGRGSTKLKIADSRIECTEFVDDIKKAYYEADVLVSPIRIGGGTNFKVIEAMSCGLPVVMHSSRVASLELTPNENVMSADAAEDFAQKIETLLANDALQGKLAKNAREHIEKNYSWETIGKKLSKVWEEL